MRYEDLSMERCVLYLLLLKTYGTALQVQRDNRDEILNLSMKKCNAIVNSRYLNQRGTCKCSGRNKDTLTSSLISSSSSSPYGCIDRESKGGTIYISLYT